MKNQEKKETKHSEEIENYEGQSEGFNQQGYQEMYQNYPKLKREKVERGKKITDDSKTKKQ